MVEISATAGWIGTSVSVLVVTLLVVVRNWNWWRFAPKLQKGQAPLPPGDMGWPVVGHIFDFLRAFKSQQPDSFIGNMIKGWGRVPLYTTHLFGQPTVLATTSESIKQVCMNGKVFKSGWPKATRTVLGRKSFAVLEGDEHRRMRRLTAQGIQGQEALKFYIPKVEEMCVGKLTSWTALGQFPLVGKLQQFTFEVIIHIFMSYPDGPQAQQLLHDFEVMVGGLRAMAINIPGFAYHKSLQVKIWVRVLHDQKKAEREMLALFLQARKTVLKRIQAILDERRAAKANNYGDVLEALLASEDENGSHLTDEEIIDTILVFLIAGHQSSTFSITWTMIFLQRHPEVLKACRDEQVRIHQAKGPGELLTYADFRRMTFLNDDSHIGHLTEEIKTCVFPHQRLIYHVAKVIDETMRIVNVSPFVFRVVTETTQVEGFTIPKGWFVENWFRAVHTDPEVYPEPYEFKPERWKTFKPKAGQFAPFGLGNRSCIGNELAKLEMSIFLHHVILNYRWEPVNPKALVRYLPHPQPVDGYLVNFTRL